MASHQQQQPPPGYFDDAGPELLAVAVAFIVINTTATVLRYLARHLQKTPWGWDDTCMAFGWLSITGLCIESIIAPSFGVGQRTIRVVHEQPWNVPNWGWTSFYAVPITYVFASTFPKLSICIMYLRIFTHKVSRTLCWIVLIGMIVAAVINAFVLGFQCDDPNNAWNLKTPGVGCNNIQAHLIWGPFINIITDLALLALPIPTVRKLQVATHVKIGLYATFLIGSAGLITAVVRLVKFLTNHFAHDPIYWAAPLLMWAVIECSIYLVSACLMSYRPLLNRLVHGRRLSSQFARLKNALSLSEEGRFRKGMAKMPEKNSNDSSTLTPMGSNDDVSAERSTLPKVPGKIYVRREYDVTRTDAI